jgi:hypothetical protein
MSARRRFKRLYDKVYEMQIPSISHLANAITNPCTCLCATAATK